MTSLKMNVIILTGNFAQHAPYSLRRVRYADRRFRSVKTQQSVPTHQSRNPSSVTQTLPQTQSDLTMLTAIRETKTLTSLKGIITRQTGRLNQTVLSTVLAVGWAGTKQTGLPRSIM